MTITLHLSTELEQKLEKLAAAGGYADVAAYVRHLVETGVEKASPTPEIQEAFARLAEQWRTAAKYSSVARRMAEHPAYRAIVAMGEKVVPLILAELERKPDHWFAALREITGANPVPEEGRGKLKEMAEAWLKWGREQGYRW